MYVNYAFNIYVCTIFSRYRIFPHKQYALNTCSLANHAIVHLDSGELAVVMHVLVFTAHVTLVLVYVIALMDG